MSHDNLESKGYISKTQILTYVSQEDIYELVFDFKPVEFQYVISPFRQDNNPGCWFSTDITTDKLRFIDFGNSDVIDGIRMSHLDCFDAVQVYYNLKNFYKTLEYIHTRLIKGKRFDITPQQKSVVIKEVRKVLINIEPTFYTEKDGRFWSPYDITKDQLIKDGTFSVKRYQLLNTKFGDIVKRPSTNCYAFTRFNEGRKKLYSPFKKEGKFITNCISDDVGGLEELPDFGERLVITKSYKDWRVLTNQGLICVWLQNEGMIPSDDILIDLARRFKHIIVFFDNDEPGIKAGIKIKTHINRLYKNKAVHIHLPESLNVTNHITDPSDLYKKKGKKHLHQFLNETL
jgi:hypothetical protein